MRCASCNNTTTGYLCSDCIMQMVKDPYGRVPIKTQPTSTICPDCGSNTQISPHVANCPVAPITVHWKSISGSVPMADVLNGPQPFEFKYATYVPPQSQPHTHKYSMGQCTVCNQKAVL